MELTRDATEYTSAGTSAGTSTDASVAALTGK
jgi:hypothetical protein